MMAKDALAFALSQEELFVVLSYLKVKRLAGLGNEALSGLSEKEARLVMEVAERALLARGFLVQGAEDQLKLTDPVSALVGACALPETSLAVTCTRPGCLPENCYFHVAGKMHVMHAVPLSAIHQFITVEDRRAIAREALSILQLGTLSAVTCAAGELEEEKFLAARKAAQEGDREKTEDMLVKAGLHAQTASVLAAALADPVASTTLTCVEKAGLAEEVDGVTVLQGKDSLWLLTPQQAGKAGGVAGRLTVQPVSTIQINQRVKAMLKL